jgi:hypothetical protein
MRPYVRYVAVALAGTLIWAACGGDDSEGDDVVASCKQACNKLVSLCFADAGGFFNCDTSCAPKDGGGTGGSQCTNTSEANAAFKACLEKNTCDELTSCFRAVPCQGGTGAGGAGGSGATGGTGGTGGGGTGGTGGTGGGTGDGGCAQLLACCNAATNETIKSSCLMGYDAIKPSGDAACGMLYTQIKPSVCP